VLTVISMLAILCLPRQFHVAVVENTSPRDLAMARWAFPIYLLVFTALVVPIAAAGIVTQGSGAYADGFLLSLPMANGQDGLALLAFLGGISAATGMVIVATIASSTMLCNEIVMPALVKLRGEEVSSRPDLARLLIRIRRMLIVGVLALSWLAYRVIGMYGTLAAIGLLSFALAAQFGPAMIGGLYWRRATRAGAIAGMWAGFLRVGWTLLIPAFAQTGWLPGSLVVEGPFGIAWLNPYGMFGLTGLDPVTHGVFWSLGINIACFVRHLLADGAAPDGKAPGGRVRRRPRPAARTAAEPSRRFTSRIGAPPRSATCASWRSASSAGRKPRPPSRRICESGACRSPRACGRIRSCST
jgi:Na+/proline symporter